MSRLDRRHLLMGLGAALTAAPSPHSRRRWTRRRQTNSLHRLAEAEQNGKVHDFHALLVSQHGKLLFDHYGKGEDEGHAIPRAVA